MRRPAVGLALLALAAGCGGGDDGPRALPQGGERVELDPARFVAEIDNTYWPLKPGSRWVYRETDGKGNEQRVDVTVLRRTKTILGIDATVVHDVVSDDGGRVEDTYDWYAQDEDGNVWYLGEQTAEFENGEVVSTAGSWQAGVDGAQPGVIVPANPRVGVRYRQEYLKGEAEDRGRILDTDGRATVPFGSFEHVLVTEDTTPLEPDVVEHKYYAKGVGPVLTRDVASGGREVLIEFVAGR